MLLKLKMISTMLTVFYAIVFFYCSEVTAKVVAPPKIDKWSLPKRSFAIKNIEQRMSRFVQFARRKGKHPLSDTSQILNQADLFYLTKVWDKLDAQVKQSYINSLEIPDSYNTFVSPGGHFEVYYSSTPIDSKLQADSISYDKTINWRHKQSIGNGVPDWVDEIAFSLDSSWSMEVERFRFQNPIPYTDNSHNSSRYKVVATDGIYGSTYPIAKSVTEKGWSSLIYIYTDWDAVGYKDNPEEAIRVTCAHEFFHSIQFAMTNNVVDNGPLQLDDYPIAWLEGTATSMEELAFPDVDDYLQYTDLYFTTPEVSFLNDYGEETLPYTNCILLLYLYRYSWNNPDISFMRTVFQNNYSQNISFQKNIQITSNTFGTTWVDLLNQFHTASFFSGERADTTRFLFDSPKYDAWTYSADTLYSYISKSQSINPCAMGIFSCQNFFNDNDTLHVTLNHSETNSSSLDKPWAASAILRKPDIDSVYPIQLNNDGDGTFTIPNWKDCKEIIIVVSNGDLSSKKEYTVKFVNCSVTHQPGDTFSIKSIAKDNKSSARFSITAINALHCESSLSVSDQQDLIEIAKNNRLNPLSSIFHLDFPGVWDSNAKKQLSITIEDSRDTNDIKMYIWNSSDKIWNEVTTTLKLSGDTLIASNADPQSGDFALFQINRSTSISIYPNPVHLHSKRMNFSGVQIKNLYIYNIAGSLIYRHDYTIQNSSNYFWDLTNSSKHMIVPGYYTAIIKYINSKDGKIETAHKKLLVTP